MALIYTGTTISFHFEGTFHQAHKSHPNFTEIVSLATSGDLRTASNLISIKGTVSKALKDTDAELRGNEVFYKGNVVKGLLARRILDMVKQGVNAMPLLRFLDNLMDNPSKRAVDELYGFLEASKLPITDDGYFLAYKSVTSDFKDHYTRTMDNSVGATVEMPRNQVDEDKDRTCSKGLHFAAYEYASSFYSEGRLVVVKINPADVVAIPSDYNNQKGRACKYDIIEEVQRDDTKLVDAGYVSTAKETVKHTQDQINHSGFDLKEGNYYWFTGYIFTSALPEVFKARVKKREVCETGIIHYSIQPEDLDYDQVCSITISHKATWKVVDAPSYVPQSDNYDDPDVWTNSVDNFYSFCGKAKEFPVNRDRGYILQNHKTDKTYRGEFFFKKYDVEYDYLVFARLNHEGDIDRWLTVKDVNDWYIEFDLDDC